MKIVLVRDGHEWLVCVRDTERNEWVVKHRCADKGSAVLACMRFKEAA